MADGAARAGTMAGLLNAVVLAAGRGSRMSRPAAGLHLDTEQRRLAGLGLKTLIPFHGHPFLSYGLTELAAAGICRVCLVVRPGEDPVRLHYQGLRTERLRLEFAVQTEPRGSANALLAAESFAAAEPFAVVNADNIIPAAAIRVLAGVDGHGLAGFGSDALLAGGIPAARIAEYALVTSNEAGELTDIVEKPGAAELRRLIGRARISMTCWRFEPSIFEACRRVPLSKRGEHELPDAVLLAIRKLRQFCEVIPVDEPVFDLSCQADIPGVAERLRGRRIAF